MKILFKTLVLLFLITGCSENPLVTKYEPSYNKVKAQLINREAEINQSLTMMPPTFSKAIDKSRKIIIKSDLAQFIKSEGMNEGELSATIAGIEKFMNLLDSRDNFRPNEQQVQIYQKLRNKAKSKEEVIRKYIANTAKSEDPMAQGMANLFKKILDNDIYGFLSQTITSEENFTQNIGSNYQNFDALVTNMTMYNYSVELDAKF